MKKIEIRIKDFEDRMKDFEDKMKRFEDKMKRFELNDIQLLNTRQSPLPTPETTTMKDFHLCQEKYFKQINSFDCLE
ncbi:hypothetical protein EKK58_04385 [Candidatus Dependentiae bacterium]|nr:MAG: hypothetical protein EKK58_04385 [Candidatus Dependentiae bacterium]